MKEIEVNREYTYKDIKDEEGRWEVIDGIPFYWLHHHTNINRLLENSI